MLIDIVRGAAAAASVVGVGSAIGWILDLPILLRPLDGMFPIPPSASGCIALTGIALLSPTVDRRPHWAMLALAGVMALLAVLIIIEAELGLGVGISRVSFHSNQEMHWRDPENNARIQAVLFVLAAIILAGLSLPHRRARIAADIAAATGLLLSSVSIIGNSLAATGLAISAGDAPLPLPGTSLYGAVGLLLISTAVLASQTAEGWLETIFGESLGALVARRLAIMGLIGVIVIPLFVYGLSSLLVTSVYLTLILLVLTVSFAGAFLMWGVARHVDELDRDRRTVEMDLQARQRREEIAHELAYAGTWELDLDAHRVSLSPSLRKLYGFPSEGQLAWDVVSTIVSPEDKPRIRELQQRAWQNGDRFQLEFRVIRPDGGLRHIQSSGAAIQQHGRRIMVGFDIDVTERREAEQRLQRAIQLADEAQNTTRRFVAGVSHELRQPVQSLVLYMDLLRRSKVGHLIPVIEGLDESVDALKHLVDTTLEIARLDNGLAYVRRENVQLGDLIDRLAREYGSRASEMGLRIVTVPTRLSVDSDPVLLERTMRILIDNALNFTERGRILIGCKRQGDQVRLVVADTGIGIAADKQEAIFEDFVQLETSGRRVRGRGFGLGLALARRFAGLLDHRVHVRSTVGRGSLFAVEAPLARTPGVRSIGDEDRPSAPDTDRLLVAVVEDDPIVRSGIRATLVAWGHTVADGPDADKAIEALSGAIPDVIIADYLLHGEAKGIEAIKTIRKACRWPVPGLMLTGGSDSAMFAELEQGGLPVLRKPVTPEALRKTIAAVVAEVPWAR